MSFDLDRNADLRRLGDELRLARLARHLSLDDVAKATKIRQSFLSALEQGQLESYSSSVFTAGHLRLYARYLHVDPAQYLALLDSPTASVPDRRTTFPSARPRYYGFRIGATATFLAGVLALGLYLTQQYAAFTSGHDVPPPASQENVLALATPIPTLTTISTSSAATPTLAPSPTTLALTPAPTATPPPLPTFAPTATLAASPTMTGGVKIDATMLGRVWVQVQSDGHVIFTGILNAGDNRTWSASQQLMLWTGDAANVSVIFNGKSVGRLGSPGQVLKVTWTATS